MNDFGNHLHLLRKQAQMSLRYLAERVNLSYSFIDSLEKGIYMPTREVVCTLAEELETDVDELLDLAGYIPNETVKKIYAFSNDRK
ncbi:hypothetical protein CSV75_03770 [Sporosarcina sp. P18a]|uniref:helix-turn-helix domain-containing protein n=1 Tax=Sporosarcina sp. P18a TaxID=2048259 RepID=UPI000C169D54|nr:helix-turn-helix transcriptional regulator [Sporosarcina sp. P18a]PIC80909.1 hypothetical protein CSV75_03770 [Sporosarcina sp. P18a]